MMQRQGEPTVEQMCHLARVNRAGYYRFLCRKEPVKADMELGNHIQQICLGHRRYGYRRVCASLRSKGIQVNHKKVLRLMRQDNLLAVQQRKFVVTTNSQHVSPVFSNYARHLRVERLNQLWVADITYIRLQSEFVYLAVVLDVFSRAVVGWALGRSLQAALPVSALERAIANKQPEPRLVHHSDRGVQYASQEYITVLEKHFMIGSMSRGGCPYDNAFCESFMKTLKQEEIYCQEYSNLEELELNLIEFIDRYYNRTRLHSALGYCSPADHEQKHRSGASL
jgi:putative transposase